MIKIKKLSKKIMLEKIALDLHVDFCYKNRQLTTIFDIYFAKNQIFQKNLKKFKKNQKRY